MGYGTPASESFSAVVWIIIFVGFGAPMLAIIIAVVYIIVKKLKRRRLSSSYGQINWFSHLQRRTCMGTCNCHFTHRQRNVYGCLVERGWGGAKWGGMRWGGFLMLIFSYLERGWTCHCNKIYFDEGLIQFLNVLSFAMNRRCLACWQAEIFPSFTKNFVEDLYIFGVTGEIEFDFLKLVKDDLSTSLIPDDIDGTFGGNPATVSAIGNGNCLLNSVSLKSCHLATKPFGPVTSWCRCKKVYFGPCTAFKLLIRSSHNAQ